MEALAKQIKYNMSDASWISVIWLSAFIIFDAIIYLHIYGKEGTYAILERFETFSK